MTTTQVPAVRARPDGSPTRRTRGKSAKRLSLWRDGLEAAAWLVTVAAISFFLASGAMVWTVKADVFMSLGRLLGIIATVLILVQVLLASRAPWIERALGHDKALRLHGAMGQPVFLILVAHAALLIIGYGTPPGRDIVAQTAYFLGHTRDIALSIVALAILLVVAVTSIAAARRRWPYETWHAIHIFAYVAIAIAVPHQFTDGTTFKDNAWARAFWAGLYVIAFGSLLVWRVVVPIVRALRHRLVVTDLERHDDGSVSVTMVGRRLDGWKARPGQFFLWRFYTKDLWLTAHPYSLSAVPDGRSLRITVKPLGDDSAAVGRLTPGTRVSASGPYGRFVHDARIRQGLVLVGAGIGIAPVRAMLEGYRAGDGPCDIIVRGSSAREVPLLDEMRTLAVERGARLHEVFGHRGDGWTAAEGPQSLALLVPAPSDCDLFVCGPEDWAERVRGDALACGIDREAIHIEEYDW